MSRIREIQQAGSQLCIVDLCREADGSISAEIIHMPPRLIETTGIEVADRMQIVAGWLDAGARNIRQTGGLANDR
jgi:hypothetical protein